MTCMSNSSLTEAIIINHSFLLIKDLCVGVSGSRSGAGLHSNVPGSIEFKGNAPCIISNRGKKEWK